jgi:hypothetical protein
MTIKMDKLEENQEKEAEKNNNEKQEKSYS